MEEFALSIPLGNPEPEETIANWAFFMKVTTLLKGEMRDITWF